VASCAARQWRGTKPWFRATQFIRPRSSECWRRCRDQGFHIFHNCEGQRVDLANLPVQQKLTKMRRGVFGAVSDSVTLIEAIR